MEFNTSTGGGMPPNPYAPHFSPATATTTSASTFSPDAPPFAPSPGPHAPPFAPSPVPHAPQQPQHHPEIFVDGHVPILDGSFNGSGDYGHNSSGFEEGFHPSDPNGQHHSGQHQDQHGIMHSGRGISNPPVGNEEYHELHTIVADGGDRYGVSAVAFDLHQELLWMGNQGGHVTSYYGPGMQKYSSFQPLPVGTEMRQVLSIDNGVLLLGNNRMRCSERGGLTIFDFSGEDMHDMQVMTLVDPTTLLIGGHQDKVIEFDLNSGQQVNLLEVGDPGVAIFRHTNRFICCGDTSGQVTLRDMNTFKVEHILKAHSGSLSDFDVHGNLLVTAGFSTRRGSLAVDRFLMIYDLRVMRAMAPMQLSIDPMFLRFVPTYTPRIVAVSQAGQFQILDLAGVMTPASMAIHQLNTHGHMCMGFDISTSCEAFSFGDNGGLLHLWTDREEVLYNNYSHPTEFADHPEHLPAMSIVDPLTPLASIPMLYENCHGPLLSDWPEDCMKYVKRRMPPIDPEILASMKVVQFIGYAPNPRVKKRNQVPYRAKDLAITIPATSPGATSTVPESPGARGESPRWYMVPKRYRKVEIKYTKLGVDSFDFRHYNRTNFAGLETNIPNSYCNAMLQVLYFIEPLRCAAQSHLCEKEFCLTCELGFLFHMLDMSKGENCQASNFLRAFRTIPEASALGLVLGDQEEATGKVNLGRLIQSWNRFIVQQVHQDIQEPKEEDSEKKEGEETEPPKEVEKTPIEKMFSSEVTISSKCRCGKETTKETNSMVYGLNYPDISDSEIKKKQYAFTEVLKSSMSSEQVTHAWCEDCNRYQPTTQSRKLKSLPDILAINCHLDSERDLLFWKTQEEKMPNFVPWDQIMKQKEENSSKASSSQTRTVRPCRYGSHCTRSDCKFSHGPQDKEQTPCRYGDMCTRADCKFSHRSTAEKQQATVLSSAEILEMSLQEEAQAHWLPCGLKMALSDGELKIEGLPEMEDVEKEKLSEEWAVYELTSSVCHVQESRLGGNLVAHIKAGIPYHKRKEGITATQWYLVNDFAIAPMDKLDAVQFGMAWKVPCVLYFSRKDLNKRHDCQIHNPISEKVLFPEASLSSRVLKRHITFQPLAAEEMPKEGDLVALDAEFVTLNQEEAELHSDGTRSTIKPSHMSVARITVIRGQGPQEGTPFIDDYISTQEQVVDYLTKFSGIKPGDLDANISSKHLTTLKSTYLKLRYLIDKGVKMVGHGLKKDFRVINLFVPKDQIVDTVLLFHLTNKRMMSLRFLAWYFLKLRIQSDTHDSIEDARTALQLHKKFKQLKDEQEPDEFHKTLRKMYEEGRKVGWKPPDE
ncbi:PREDICTED: PAB-dependent poly(A)-specific ribonuclease subunit PAN2-like isoform X1 [Branchiostoma belcheri]|uniref:PAN2-PAN3 deadenylation complex catalytic subunit PAN2 n=1 Tax=Branchiostoma belcheri TaxID=7741 RepID=A0A6P4Z9G3_BRABE|nr:PREDICTED: PAB-dependent poly(A)-specific ribonuclease subunit PAN2-like isoform X1 [Branchiostoma belcheri]